MVSLSKFISPEYAAQLSQMHSTGKFNGASGRKHLSTISYLVGKVGVKSILDYGSGVDSFVTIAEVSVVDYDPAVPGKDALPASADLVICTDVLEHIEPDKLQDVLAHIHSLTIKMCFVVIATRPADKRLPDGRNAHLIIDNAAWWVAQLRAFHWSLWIHNLDDGQIVIWLRKDNMRQD